MVYFYWVIDVLVSNNLFKQNILWTRYFISPFGCRWQDIWQLDKVCELYLIRNLYFILEAAIHEKSFMNIQKWIYELGHKIIVANLNPLASERLTSVSVWWLDRMPAIAANASTVLYLPNFIVSSEFH